MVHLGGAGVEVRSGVLETGGEVGAESPFVLDDDAGAGAGLSFRSLVELGVDARSHEGVLEDFAELVFADTAEVGTELGLFGEEVEGAAGVEGGSAGDDLDTFGLEEFVVYGELFLVGQTGLTVGQFVLG